MTELYDIHAHLDMLDESPEVALEKAKSAGVTKIFTIGTEPSGHQFVLDVARRLYPDVYCTLGVHPHQSSLYTKEVEEFISRHLPEKEVVAVGEIGLDYYYNNASGEIQREVFRQQLELASCFNLPVEIHTRDAEKDTVEILQEYQGRVRGVIHCFTGTAWLAQKCLDLGYNISFSGIVTFKNAEDLRKTCLQIPLDRLHVETDAPFLTPVPKRGIKNTPCFVTHTAAFIASLRGSPLEEFASATNENARQLFKKMI